MDCEGSEERGIDRSVLPRADVARAVVQCLDDDATVGHAILLYGGDTPIEEALRTTE